MRDNKSKYKCEWCGSDCETFREGMTQGIRCKNCDFSIVTTYNPFRDVPWSYEVSFLLPESLNCEHYKFFSNILGLNYVQLRNAAKYKYFKVSRDIYGTLNLMEKLEELGVKFWLNCKVNRTL
jgi:DNA-directed RNA polymerase subunit RPC12/RpoP